MHVTRFTDYSVRILLFLALSGDSPATIRDIAQSYAVSKNHLMKIVQHLGAKGYINTTRGKNGGLTLARAPSQINIGTLVREIEYGIPLVECLGDNNKCVISPACRLQHVFREALDSFFLVLDQYTLADLVTVDMSLMLHGLVPPTA